MQFKIGGRRLFTRSAFALALIVSVCALSPAQTAPGGSGNPPALTDKQIALKARAEAATQRYIEIIQRHAGEYGVDPALLMAVITVESDGDPNSLSSAGAMGLMQLMPSICSDFQLGNPYDPDQNIRGGTALLASHFKRYKGDIQKVLAAYNAGPRHADDGSWIFIGQTKRYVPAVLAYYEALKGSVDALVPYQGEPPITIPAIDPATYYPPPVRYEEMMFNGIRTSVNVADPASIAENPALEDVATSLLTDYQDGKLDPKRFQAVAIKRLAVLKKHPKTLKAYCLTSAAPTDFTTEWDKQAPMAGGFVGVAHGLSKGGHIWVVLVATL